MNVLEKILEEIEEKNKIGDDCDENLAFIDGVRYGLIEAKNIIRFHMDDGKDINVPSNWIPCSERLPSEEEFIKAYCRNSYAAEFIVMIKGATLPTTLYFKNGSWTDMEGDYYNVVAWQPLPEPYKGEEVAG